MSLGMFLVVVWFVHFEVSCDVCCEDYECSSWKSETNCSGRSRCRWFDGSCKDYICSDRSSHNCLDGYGCFVSGDTCRTATSCSDFTTSGSCSGYYLGADMCIWYDGACKVAACTLFTQSDCENAYYIQNCKFNDGLCAATTSCGDWTSRPTDCPSKSYESVDCIFDEGVCRSESCADFNNQESLCKTAFRCNYAGTACTKANTCGDFTSQDQCRSLYPPLCRWNSSKCETVKCSDFDNSRFDCSQNCYYVDASECPVKESDSASVIYFPIISIVAMLLMFLLQL